MDQPIDFTLTKIQTLHTDRTDKIRSLTHPANWNTPSTDSPAVAYSLAHHVLEGMEAAGRTRQTSAFEWYQAHPDAGATDKFSPTAVGPRLILSPDLAHLPRSPISETPYYVLGPDTTKAPLGLRSITATACATAEHAGFGDLLAAHAVVICLLRTKALGETLDSWTINRLPGTVYVDHTGEPLVLARDLIHEAGHNWLNDALAATDCKISDEKTFYSPWKESRRPAFGFLHACWAFPLTVLYTASVLDQTRGDLRRYLTAYLDKQRRLLADTADDHQQALQLITDPELRERLHSAHQQALSL
jgi:hypothetical protein